MRRGLILAASLTATVAAGGLALAQSPAQTSAAKSRAAEPISHGPAEAPAPAPAKPAKPAAPTAPQAAAAPAELTRLSVKDIMRHIVNPAAESFWAHSGEVDDEKGANDRIPTNDATWAINIDNAAQIIEAANLLMTEGRARDPNGPWMKYAIALNKAGVAGMAAATAHDHDKTNDAGSAMYDACFQCHGRYIPRPKDSLYKHSIDQDLADAEKAKAAQKAGPPPK